MIPNKVASIMRSLLNNGHEAYIIGGAVREIESDSWLPERPSDDSIAAANAFLLKTRRGEP